MHRIQLRFVRTAVVTLLLAAPPGIARAQSTTSFGVAGGLSVPIGDYLNGLSTGYNVAVSLGMRNKLSPMGFRVEGAFNELAFPGAGDAKHRIAAGIANLTYDLSGVAGPSTSGGLYAIGGIGIYGSYDRGTDQYGINYDNTNTQWNAGLNVGLGWRFPLSGMSAFLEGRYHYLFTNSSDYNSANYNAGNAQLIPITFGISF